MKAETTYNVIQALDQQERERLNKMLGYQAKKISVKKSKIWTETEVIEGLIVLFKKRKNKGYDTRQKNKENTLT